MEATVMPGHMLLDLGAVYWLDQVRIIGGGMVPRIWALGYYEVMTSDGSLAPDGSFIWTRHFFGEAPAHLRASGLVDHHFDLIPARYVRIVWRPWNTFQNFAPSLSSFARGAWKNALKLKCSRLSAMLFL